MVLLDGKEVATAMESRVAAETARLMSERGIRPGLAVILVGEDPASAAYVRSKGRACERLGFHSVTTRIPASTTQEELLSLITDFNNDPAIHGILVQMPVPKHIDPDLVVQAIDYRKDVDGFHPMNVGRMVIGLPASEPCTPVGILGMIRHYNIRTQGKRVVVVGRGALVGRPLAIMMSQKREGGNAIVTVAHSAAENLGEITRQADILVAAIGRPRYITADMVRNDAIVIDVGINRIDDPASPKGYRLVGDVDFENVAPTCSAITPVPGGVGLTTVAALMENTLRAAVALTASSVIGQQTNY